MASLSENQMIALKANEIFGIGEITITNKSDPSTIEIGNLAIYWDNSNNKLMLKRGNGDTAEVSIGNWS